MRKNEPFFEVDVIQLDVMHEWYAGSYSSADELGFD